VRILFARTGTVDPDSLCLALANYHGCPLVTADKKFYELISKKATTSGVIWVEDIAKKRLRESPNFRSHFFLPMV
jgi:hypothetical protein